VAGAVAASGQLDRLPPWIAFSVRGSVAAKSAGVQPPGKFSAASEQGDGQTAQALTIGPPLLFDQQVAWPGGGLAVQAIETLSGRKPHAVGKPQFNVGRQMTERFR